MQHLSLAVFIAVSFSAASAQPVLPSAAPSKPELTPEMRGDIYMARKMYREAIDTFRSANLKDPVLLNKTGIAYHQMMQLDNARKRMRDARNICSSSAINPRNSVGVVARLVTRYRSRIDREPSGVGLA